MNELQNIMILLRKSYILYQYTKTKETEKELYANLYSLENKLNTYINENNRNIIDIFLDQYYIFLVDLQKGINIINSKAARQYNNNIFQKILSMKGTKPSRASLIFAEFIKGISYFKDEESNIFPIYHRLGSCGPNNNLKEMQCSFDKNNKLIKYIIKKCYLERLIYNKIYLIEDLNGSTNGLDKAHIDIINDHKKIYKSCYPGSDIEVNIEYNLNLPTILTIYYKKSNKTIIETYNKLTKLDPLYNYWKYDDNIVICNKTINNKNYCKVQDYNNYSNKWYIIRNNRSEGNINIYSRSSSFRNVTI